MRWRLRPVRRRFDLMRPAVVFIIVTIMIDAMGIGLIIPVMPDLIREVNGGDLSNAALWGGVMATTFAVMQFLFGPVMGGLSDRFGRRPVLLIALVVMAADYVLMSIAGSIWLLIVGRVIGGITAATHATAAAYMADISKPEDRAANFGLIGAGFGIGFILGPLMGGALAEYGTRAPFWAATVLAIGNATLGYFVLKETITPENRRAFDWRRANPFGALKVLGKLPGIRRLLVVYFIYHVAFAVYPSVWAFFGKERYAWTPAMIGYSLGLFGIMMALVQAGLIRVVLRKFGERGTVFAGHLFSILAFGVIAVVTSGTWAMILTPLAAFAGVIPPALQGIMSRQVAANAQGELQGALSSAVALAMIVSPMAMTATFAHFTGPTTPIYLPGAPFLMAMGLAILSLYIFLKHRSSEPLA